MTAGSAELPARAPPAGASIGRLRIDADRRQGADRRGENLVRIAAVGDLHCGEEDAGAYREAFAEANERSDVLVLCGDLTRRGLPSEFSVAVAELADVKVPVVAVLGNHDFESGKIAAGLAVLRGRGVHVLSGDTFELNAHVGFAGVKGFMGGFGRGTLTAFGEDETKAFVQAAEAEVSNLELALRRLSTPMRVAILHYSPVLGTVLGEPEMIYPFLGTDRLGVALDRYKATIAFHGHAHSGAFRGQTTGGVPVYNVALSVIRREGIGRLFYVHELALRPASAL